MPLDYLSWIRRLPLLIYHFYLIIDFLISTWQSQLESIWTFRWSIWLCYCGVDLFFAEVVFTLHYLHSYLWTGVVSSSHTLFSHIRFFYTSFSPHFIFPSLRFSRTSFFPHIIFPTHRFSHTYFFPHFVFLHFVFPTLHFNYTSCFLYLFFCTSFFPHFIFTVINFSRTSSLHIHF